MANAALQMAGNPTRKSREIDKKMTRKRPLAARPKAPQERRHNLHAEAELRVTPVHIDVVGARQPGEKPFMVPGNDGMLIVAEVDDLFPQQNRQGGEGLHFRPLHSFIYSIIFAYISG